MRAAIVLLGILAGSQVVAADEPVTFTLRFQIATVDGARVVDDAWVDERVAEANTIFRPAGVAFARAPTVVRAGRADLITRAHRHQLNPDVVPDVINVFVVRSLADVDIPGRFIRGVHWRSRRGSDATQHYCILSTISGPTVLAHELGHFFGNPHSETPGNIMSYTRGDVPPFFDAGQLRRIRRFRRRFLERGELRPVVR